MPNIRELFSLFHLSAVHVPSNVLNCTDFQVYAIENENENVPTFMIPT